MLACWWQWGVKPESDGYEFSQAVLTWYMALPSS
jgi:hypothetical protein